jgi:hypothetical protein
MSAPVKGAAKWLATTPDAKRPHPIVPYLRKTFALSPVEACEAIREANRQGAARMNEQGALHIIGLHHLKNEVAELERAACQHAAAAELPADLVDRMRSQFSADPTLPWEDALRKALEVERP